MNYFDFILDDLIYIIFSYLKIENNLKLLEDRYEYIYKRYINSIHLGYTNIFKCTKINIFDIKVYEFFVPYGNILSSSKYEKFLVSSERERKLGCNVGEIYITPSVIISKYDYIIFYKSIIYDSGSISHLFIFIGKIKKMNGDKLQTSYGLFIKKDGSIYNYESFNWKDIWDKLPINEQNSILYQNDIPIRDDIIDKSFF